MALPILPVHFPALAPLAPVVPSTTGGDAFQQVFTDAIAKVESFGVMRVPALGHPFDAVHHEAIATAPVDDASKDGIVLAVVKEGYTIGDELLRPASVIVGTLTR